MSANLECPLCAAVVAADAPDIAPGTCPGCGARYEGGEGDAPGAVAVALRGFGADDLPATDVLNAIFRLSSGDALASRVAVTSDHRDDFYLWWVFVREDEGSARDVLALLVNTSG